MAGKQTYTVPVRLSEDLLRKLIYVSEAEGRTPNNQFTFMLRNNIQYFERAKSKIPASELAKIYKNHEVAAHTLTHPHLPPLPDAEVIRQVERDRLNLSDIVGYEVVGMAYPGGGMNNNDRVARLIKSHTGIRYARTISLGYSFLPQEDLYRYKPTAFHLDFKNNYSLARDFFEREEEGVFYIWGHSYEFDINNTWDEFDDFCKYVSGRDDIFYGTNKEILL